MPKYTVAYGNAFDGHRLFGIFDDFDVAEEYAATHKDMAYWVVEIEEA